MPKQKPLAPAKQRQVAEEFQRYVETLPVCPMCCRTRLISLERQAKGICTGCERKASK